MSAITSPCFDEGTTNLLNELNNIPNIDKLKQFIEEEEFDYELIKDDIEGPKEESDILDIVGQDLYTEIKSIICSTNDQDSLHVNEQSLPLALEMSRDINHSFDYDDKSLTFPHQESIGINLSDDESDDDWEFINSTDVDEKKDQYDDNNVTHSQIENLIEMLQPISNKEGIKIIQHFLLEQDYESIEAIKDDIQDPSNSMIYEELVEQHNIDITFFSAFCSKVREIDNQIYIENAIVANDEWSVILQRMMRNTTFSNKDYQAIVNYFREEQWTVQSYRDDEMDDEYENSQIPDIFPDKSDDEKKKLIKIFENAITNRITPSAPPVQNYNVANNNNETEEKKQDIAAPIQNMNENKNYNNESDAAIEEGNVDDENHPRYKKIERIIDRCGEMIHPGTNGPNQDCDLKALCSVLDINQVLEISDILCRQYLIPLYLKDKSQCHELLREISTDPDNIVLLEKFVVKTYWKKQHEKSKFSLYLASSIAVLKMLRYLGYQTPPISHISYDEYVHPSCQINKLCCNARDVQIYVFGFLISSTRMLIKNFEQTNVTLVLDMKFPVIHYADDEGTMRAKELIRQSLNDLHSKIMKFEEPFQNNAVRGTVRDAIEKEHCMMIQKIDFTKPKIKNARWNNLKPKLCAANKKYLGFDVSDKEYMKLFDGCKLFQLCRVKKYLMDQNKTEGHTASDGRPSMDPPDRLCVSLHKFGNTLTFYLHFENSVFRLRVEDLCEWFPNMFKKHDTALTWDTMEHELRKYDNDFEKLANVTLSGMMAVPQFNIYNNGNKAQHKQKEKTNFWRNIHKWSDLDKEFYRKCDQFTYEMKEKYGIKYNTYVFDKNIVDRESVIKNKKSHL